MFGNQLAADHVQRPRNRGELADATHKGVCGVPGDGPFVTIWLILEGDQIIRATYQTHGCPSSIAASSVLCELVCKVPFASVSTISPADLLTILGGLPEGKEQFASMALEALRDALRAPTT